MLILCGAAACSTFFSDAASAQTLQLDCYTVHTGVVACRSSYSNGEAAIGANLTLYSEQNKKLGDGTTDKNGVFIFKAPPDQYEIVITAGAAHAASLSSPDISEKPQRPGWRGDWVPVAAVDHLDKLQRWEDQFTSEKAPLVKRVEDEIAK